MYCIVLNLDVSLWYENRKCKSTDEKRRFGAMHPFDHRTKGSLSFRHYQEAERVGDDRGRRYFVPFTDTP